VGRGEGREGLRDQLRHRQRQPALDQHADHPQRMAAQRKRVLVAGGHLADAEQPGQGLQLVGQRDREADRVARQRVTGEARAVVVLDA
jgi:selenophosphate synthase